MHLVVVGFIVVNVHGFHDDTNTSCKICNINQEICSNLSFPRSDTIQCERVHGVLVCVVSLS